MTVWHLMTLWRFDSPAWLVALVPLAYLQLQRQISTQARWTSTLAALAFLLATVSPIAVLADGYLFSAHIIQHLLFLLIIPPLLLAALPEARVRRALRHPFVNGTVTQLGSAPTSWGLGLGMMWLWHVPTLCSASVSSTGAYVAQIVTLIAAGLAFAWPLMTPMTEHRMQPGIALIYLFSACVACTLLGVLLTFIPVSACPIYGHHVDTLGLTPLLRHQWHLDPMADQHLGGLLMWVPPCLLYVSASMVFAARALDQGTPHPQSETKGALNERR